MSSGSVSFYIVAAIAAFTVGLAANNSGWGSAAFCLLIAIKVAVQQGYVDGHVQSEVEHVHEVDRASRMKKKIEL